MNFDADEQSRISALSPFMRLVFDTLTRWITMLIDGKCDEDSISDAASKINASTQGYAHEDNYLTLDKAMKILGFGQNRVGCLNLMRKHGIRNEKFNNVSIGYNRDKVVALKRRLEAENIKVRR